MDKEVASEPGLLDNFNMAQLKMDLEKISDVAKALGNADKIRSATKLLLQASVLQSERWHGVTWRLIV